MLIRRVIQAGTYLQEHFASRMKRLMGWKEEGEDSSLTMVEDLHQEDGDSHGVFSPSVQEASESCVFSSSFSSSSSSVSSSASRHGPQVLLSSVKVESEDKKKKEHHLVKTLSTFEEKKPKKSVNEDVSSTSLEAKERVILNMIQSMTKVEEEERGGVLEREGKETMELSRMKTDDALLDGHSSSLGLRVEKVYLSRLCDLASFSLRLSQLALQRREEEEEEDGCGGSPGVSSPPSVRRVATSRPDGVLSERALLRVKRENDKGKREETEQEETVERGRKVLHHDDRDGGEDKGVLPGKRRIKEEEEEQEDEPIQEKTRRRDAGTQNQVDPWILGRLEHASLANLPASGNLPNRREVSIQLRKLLDVFQLLQTPENRTARKDFLRYLSCCPALSRQLPRLASVLRNSLLLSDLQRQGRVTRPLSSPLPVKSEEGLRLLLRDMKRKKSSGTEKGDSEAAQEDSSSPVLSTPPPNLAVRSLFNCKLALQKKMKKDRNGCFLFAFLSFFVWLTIISPFRRRRTVAWQTLRRVFSLRCACSLILYTEPPPVAVPDGLRE